MPIHKWDAESCCTLWVLFCFHQRVTPKRVTADPPLLSTRVISWGKSGYYCLPLQIPSFFPTGADLRNVRLGLGYIGMWRCISPIA
jgi:hypothetical protein